MIGKSPKTKKIYPALPESPGGILKRKKSSIQTQDKSSNQIQEKSSKIILESSNNSIAGVSVVTGGGGKKRRRSESDNDELDESVNDNDDDESVRGRKSKRIRFNPLDSYGESIDEPKFSEDED